MEFIVYLAGEIHSNWREEVKEKAKSLKIHTSASIIHVDDYLAAKELLLKLVKACDSSAVQSILRND